MQLTALKAGKFLVFAVKQKLVTILSGGVSARHLLGDDALGPNPLYCFCSNSMAAYSYKFESLADSTLFFLVSSWGGVRIFDLLLTRPIPHIQDETRYPANITYLYDEGSQVGDAINIQSYLHAMHVSIEIVQST